MAGTEAADAWVRDNLYVSYLAGEAITLGTLVQVSTAADSTVLMGTTDTLVCAGVAVSAPRGNAATAGTVPIGKTVVVARRGVVRVANDSGVTHGDNLACCTGGLVKTYSPGSGTALKRVGIALETQLTGVATLVLLTL